VLQDFTLEAFAGCVGNRFAISLDEEELALELVSAAALGGATTEVPPGDRLPFSLEFLGPAEPVLAQATYGFEHAALGAFELFIVPIGRDESGVRYEAVFT
jgi:hypothetical protein